MWIDSLKSHIGLQPLVLLCVCVWRAPMTHWASSYVLLNGDLDRASLNIYNECRIGMQESLLNVRRCLVRPSGGARERATAASWKLALPPTRGWHDANT